MLFKCNCSINPFTFMSNFDYKLAKNVFSTQWFSIEEIPSLSLSEKPYYSVCCPDSVIILAQTVEKEFILVRQFRPPQNKYTFELPSGYVYKTEHHQDSVQRELLEETGYSCEKITYLGNLYLCYSRINSTVHAYCGINAKLTKDKCEKEIEVILVSPATFEKYILDGTYSESTGIAVYYLSLAKQLI